jgi:DNA (cytosine-5)-methyltransferase 1
MWRECQVRENTYQEDARSSAPTFIDIFAGCGGLSLGLMMAGWRGVFAVEKEPQAFSTLRHNLAHKDSDPGYSWPDWLPCKHITVSRLISKYSAELSKLKGQVDLLAGGPPCQGFSFAGKRKKSDARNHLFRDYLHLVEIVRPKYLLLENVKGITVEFLRRKAQKRGRKARAFSDKIKAGIEKLGYTVDAGLVKAVEFGVPQLRPRFILFAVRNDLLMPREQFVPLALLDEQRGEFLASKGLPTYLPISAQEALSDLEVGGARRIPSEDSKGFEQIEYVKPQTTFQRLLHSGCNGAPNSMRLARHRDEIAQRFSQILRTCRRGISLSDADRKRFNLSKRCVVVLDANKPSHTLTTLPDDLLHYSEPRILTVREYARLQSFPDWYKFLGKYTTGGHRRRKECPRYTQVGNAVPPLLAEAIGRTLRIIIEQSGTKPLAKAACL